MNLEVQMNKNNEQKSNLIKIKVDIQEFRNIIEDLTDNTKVISLKDYVQHMKTSRYKHCYCVAYYTYIICKKLGLDYISAARGAMLHDFYFYDSKTKNDNGKIYFHAYRHPRIALNNATEIFELNDLEKDIIIKHMWPLTLRLPRFYESYIVTLVDKYCALKEFFGYFKIRKKLKLLQEFNNNKEQKN